MSFISPSLIAHIFHALGQDRGCDAVRLLRQHSFPRQTVEDHQLLPAVLRLADEYFYKGDIRRAEEHYQLGLALYQQCFPDNHAEALNCASGLITIYHDRNEHLPALMETILLAEQISRALRSQYMRPQALAV